MVSNADDRPAVSRRRPRSGGTGLMGALTPHYHATYKGQPVAMGHAVQSELEAIAGNVAARSSRDILVHWSVFAIRFSDGRDAELHALGWRLELATTWVTSPLTAVDWANRMVTTSSGHAYRLSEPDLPDLHPLLRQHLLYALETWGFQDVGH